MRIKGNYVERQFVKFVTEGNTLQEAYDFLIETGYRCIPVLDKNSKKFVGNIYKVHILEHEKEHSLQDKVSTLVSNSDVFISENASFFKVFFSIKQFPYIAVVDEKKEFMGILTHAKVLEILEDSWGVKTGGYALTLATNDYVGTLAKISKIVNKYTTIQSVITLDNEFILIRRIVVTLPKELSQETLDIVVSELEDHGLRVVHVENL